MGIFDAIKAQFIEVIEWLDESGNTMLYRFPVRGQEIKNGAQLIVRESQVAVFVFEGQIADVFTPGRYTINGGNTPILSQARRVEIRLQLALQIRSLFRQHQAVHRPQVGHDESHHDEGCGFRHGALARVWHLLDSRRRPAHFHQRSRGHERPLRDGRHRRPVEAHARQRFHGRARRIENRGARSGFELRRAGPVRAHQAERRVQDLRA